MCCGVCVVWCGSESDVLLMLDEANASESAVWDQNLSVQVVWIRGMTLALRDESRPNAADIGLYSNPLGMLMAASRHSVQTDVAIRVAAQTVAVAMNCIWKL